MKFTKQHLLNMKRSHWSRTGSYSPPKKRLTKKCLICGRLYERPVSIAVKSKTCSDRCRYKYQSLIAKPQPMTDELKLKISKTKRENRSSKGNKNPNWRGGKTKELNKGRATWQFYDWRKKVFERDKYKCRICGKTGKIEAHHLLNWINYKELRYDVNNGITVCKLHHKKLENHE